MSLKQGAGLHIVASVKNGIKSSKLLDNKNKAQKLLSKSVGSPHLHPMNQTGDPRALNDLCIGHVATHEFPLFLTWGWCTHSSRNDVSAMFRLNSIYLSF